MESKMTEKPEQSVGRQVPEMKTELTLVSFVLAKLLKEAGFDWECELGFNIVFNARTINPNGIKNFNSQNDAVSLPPLDLAQKWFRDVQGIHLSIIPKIDYYIYNTYMIIDDAVWSVRTDDTTKFATYELAQEAGLIQACKYLISQSKTK